MCYVGNFGAWGRKIRFAHHGPHPVAEGFTEGGRILYAGVVRSF